MLALLPLLGTLLTTQSPAEAEPPPEAATTKPGGFEGRVVVFGLKSNKELAAVAQRATEHILLHLGKRSGIKAVGEAEIQLLVAHEKDKTVLQGCKEGEDCLAGLSRIAEADKLITGH